MLATRLAWVVLCGCPVITACAIQHGRSRPAQADTGNAAVQADAGLDAGSDAAADGGRPAFDAGSDPDRNHPAQGQVCARETAILCAAEAACCTRPGRDRETCLKERMKGCLFDHVSALAEVGFDAEAVSASLTALEQRAASCQLQPWFASPLDLYETLPGTLGKNDSCRPPLGPGVDLLVAQIVSWFSCRWAADLACSGDFKCVPRSNLGAACVIDRSCVDGLYCDGVEQHTTCREQLPIGATCHSAHQCSSSVCRDEACAAAEVDDLYCPYPGG